jgi:hypothetical protein
MFAHSFLLVDSIGLLMSVSEDCYRERLVRTAGTAKVFNPKTPGVSIHLDPGPCLAVAEKALARI